MEEAIVNWVVPLSHPIILNVKEIMLFNLLNMGVLRGGPPY